MVRVCVPELCSCGAPVIGVWYNRHAYYVSWFNQPRYYGIRQHFERNRKIRSDIYEYDFSHSKSSKFEMLGSDYLSLICVCQTAKFEKVKALRCEKQPPKVAKTITNGINFKSHIDSFKSSSFVHYRWMSEHINSEYIGSFLSSDWKRKLSEENLTLLRNLSTLDITIDEVVMDLRMNTLETIDKKIQENLDELEIGITLDFPFIRCNQSFNETSITRIEMAVEGLIELSVLIKRPGDDISNENKRLELSLEIS